MQIYLVFKYFAPVCELANSHLCSDLDTFQSNCSRCGQLKTDGCRGKLPDPHLITSIRIQWYSAEFWIKRLFFGLVSRTLHLVLHQHWPNFGKRTLLRAYILHPQCICCKLLCAVVPEMWVKGQEGFCHPKSTCSNFQLATSCLHMKTS